MLANLDLASAGASQDILTRQVIKRALRNISRSDQTLGESSPVQEKGEHGHVTGSEVHLRALEPLAPHSYIQTVEIHSA